MGARPELPDKYKAAEYRDRPEAGHDAGGDGYFAGDGGVGHGGVVAELYSWYAMVGHFSGWCPLCGGGGGEWLVHAYTVPTICIHAIAHALQRRGNDNITYTCDPCMLKVCEIMRNS